MRATGRGERGSATVHAATVCAVLVVTAMIALQLAVVAVHRHEVAAAADLAALAGSSAVVAGRPGCAGARRVARANHARLVGCVADGPVVTVRVGARSPRLWGRRWDLVRTARAAPSDYG